MSNIVHAGRLQKEDQLFFIEKTQIPAIQSISLNYTTNETLLKHLGANKLITVPTGPEEGDISVSYLTTDSDYFYEFVSNPKGFNGFLTKNRQSLQNSFGFISGYVTSYRNRCRIGDIPQTEVSIKTFGGIGVIEASNPNITGFFAHITGSFYAPSPRIASSQSVEFNLNDSTSNRVISYDLSFNVQRIPYYEIGHRNPTKVELNWPIEVTCSVEIEEDNYIALNQQTYPCSGKEFDLSLKLKSYNDNKDILTFSVPQMRLIGESKTVDVDSNATITATYRGFIFEPTGYLNPPTIYHTGVEFRFAVEDGTNLNDWIFGFSHEDPEAQIFFSFPNTYSNQLYEGGEIRVNPTGSYVSAFAQKGNLISPIVSGTMDKRLTRMTFNPISEQADFAGTFRNAFPFTGNGNPDRVYQNIINLGAFTTGVKNMQLYQVNSRGEWDSGMVWSTVSKVRPARFVPWKNHSQNDYFYKVHPLVISLDGDVVNSGFGEPLFTLDINNNNVRWYADNVGPTYGYMKFFIEYEDGTIHYGTGVA